MTKNYFRTMARCALISLAVLVAATVFKLPPFLAMGGAVLPLVLYHLRYLAPQARTGLTQTAIDSVYYYGFLVTVAALGLSAISIASQHDGGDINTVVYQFGIGLFATGYAVVARMHLSSISAQVDEASPEALMDRYVKRSVELVSNVEMASEQLAVFSTSIIEKTARVTETARLSAEKAMLDMAKVFEVEIKATLATARDSLTTIRGLINDTSFASERKELMSSIKSTVDTATALNIALGELAAGARAGAETDRQTLLNSANLNQALRDFADRLKMFNGDDSVFAKASDSMRVSTEMIATCNSTMAGAVAGFSELAEIAGGTGPTFKSMKTLTMKASEQLENLAEASAKLGSASENLMHAALASDSLSAGIGKVTTAFAPLTVSAESLATRFASAGELSVRLENSLSSLPQHVTALKDMGDEVADSLDHICEVIEDAVKHSVELAASTAESSKSMEAANRLLASAAALEATVSSLQQVFGGLSSSVQATQTALSRSSEGITTSIARSTEAIEADVNRSAKAASLLTERLVQVAQTIIDRTRQAETVG